MVIYNQQCHWRAQPLTGPACCVCVPGNSAVWPPAQRAAETVSAALSVLQPPAPHQSTLPIPHLSLLQQLSQQSHPTAGDELCAAVHVHTGKPEKHFRLYVSSLNHNILKYRYSFFFYILKCIKQLNHISGALANLDPVESVTGRISPQDRCIPSR